MEPNATDTSGSETSETTGSALQGGDLVESIINQEESRLESEAIGNLKAPATSAQRYKLKVQGEEIEVGLDELLAGYSRQSDYTRKSQALKADRDAVETQRKALFESQAYKAIQAAAAEDGGEFDPLDVVSMTKHIRSTIAKELEAMYAPVEEAYASQTAQAKVASFVESKPEFKDPTFKKEVASLLKENSEMSLANAYEIASARRLRAEHEHLRTEAARHRSLLAEAGLQVSSGATAREAGAVPAHVLKQGAYAIAEYLAKQKGEW